jgi:hypothetical protein
MYKLSKKEEKQLKDLIFWIEFNARKNKEKK